MNVGQMTAIAVDPMLDIKEISARTGHSVKSIHQLRAKGHELYSRARKVGNRLVLEESVVGAWVERHKETTSKRLRDRKLKQNNALSESLGRLVGGDGRMSLDCGIDAIRHHSWCMNVDCQGCVGEWWWSE